MIATTIQHKVFSAFTKAGKGQTKAFVVGKDGEFVLMFGAPDDYTLLHLGACNQTFEIQVNFKKIVDFVRLSGAKSNIHVTVENDDLILDSDKVGKFVVSGMVGGYVFSYKPFGDFQYEVGADQAIKALPAVKYIDTESTRFALSCVKFDGEFAVATDGRRIICIEVCEVPEFVVPSWMVELAAAIKAPIEQYEGGLAVGNVLVNKNLPRFPNWQMVLNKTDSSMIVDIKELLERANKSLAAWKMTDQTDYPRVRFDVPEGVIDLNAKFVIDVCKPKKSGSIEMAYASGDFKNGRLTATPAHFISDGMSELIMPIDKPS